jgi:hypothetical protein
VDCISDRPVDDRQTEISPGIDIEKDYLKQLEGI